jgi:BRCA1 C Terminus (BRCT) domain
MKKQMISIVFDRQAFCFTGQLADLKRTQAQREVRARGGLIANSVTGRLDYLVIGSIAASGWSQGNYGSKIEKARELARLSKGKPYLVSEEVFLTALAETPALNSGAVDAKIVVCNYNFTLEPKQVFDRAALESILHKYQNLEGCFVSARASSSELFAEPNNSNLANAAKVKKLNFVACRIVKQFPLDAPIMQFIEEIERAFEGITGIDGRFQWFERNEGSGDYIRLLKEIPPNNQIQGL